MDEERIIEDRKKKLIGFMKNNQTWAFILLLILVIFGVYLRSLPMQDHNDQVPGNQPGLWDYTTNTWTLGPDLDPWLFERYAETIQQQGSLPQKDLMRFPPIGFDTSQETKLLPYMIVWTYYIINIFTPVNVIFAAVIFPVIMFGLTIIAFFFFVREIFVRKNKEIKTRANIIALISTLFMIVIPTFLSRTIAGIPEKESASFFFMFLALFFFLKSWKIENKKLAFLFAFISSLSTVCMGLIWGGMVYIFITIAFSCLIAFIFGKINKKEIFIYIFWVFSTILLLLLTTNRYQLKELLTSTKYALISVVGVIFFVHYIVWETKIHKKIKQLSESKIPKNIWSLIISIVLIIIVVVVGFGPSFIVQKVNDFSQTFINPITGRWSTTVAENRQPYFTEWGREFGPFLNGNIPIVFWLFFIGSVFLFKETISHIKKDNSRILTGLYVLFFFGLVFSRYASHPHPLDGEGTLSRIFYFGSALILGIAFLYYYYLDKKEKRGGFEKIEFEYIFLFSLFVLCLFTARSAVRLIMVLAPIAPIFIAYLIVTFIDKFRLSKEEISKLVYGLLAIIFIGLSLFSIWNFYQITYAQAYSFVPSYYNIQWQNSMDWVRTNTSESAVFAHWWDYGYWVQSIGKRATVLDGGNQYAYWNYLMGRHVLTGDNQTEALDYLYNHNASYLLIDSSDIGKYGAFSSIGSNKEYDRYSWIGAYELDESRIQETNNQTIFLYIGGVASDEDLIINQSGREVYLPAKSTGVLGMIVPITKNNGSEYFDQPSVVYGYKNMQYTVKMRYLYVDGKLQDFKNGEEGAVYIFPKIDRVEGGKIRPNPYGASMYLSPRLFRSLLVHTYLMDDPLKRYPNFKLAHTEENIIVDSLNKQGMTLPDFIYFDGSVQGPIKIWEIDYTGKEKYRIEFVDTNPYNYIDWQL
ncbi:MAG: STT3 domain-containing protein [Candidatus Pacearchaeota archaeon]|jgi:asparagine N-glycosylation enzyme membrane subunit Stt3